jgi:Rod binding domain-containing protein
MSSIDAASRSILPTNLAVDDAQSKIKNQKSKIAPELDEQHKKLHKATGAMETYFVGTLLKKMHESSIKGGAFEEKSESSTYRDMLDDAVASQIGQRRAFGIADMLYKQLVVQLDGPNGTASAANTAAASAANALTNDKKTLETTETHEQK